MTPDVKLRNKNKPRKKDRRAVCQWGQSDGDTGAESGLETDVQVEEKQAVADVGAESRLETGVQTEEKQVDEAKPKLDMPLTLALDEALRASKDVTAGVYGWPGPMYVLENCSLNCTSCSI